MLETVKALGSNLVLSLRQFLSSSVFGTAFPWVWICFGGV